MIPPRTSIAWFVVAIVTVALAAAVYVVPMPEPKASIVIDRATLLTGAGPGEEVALPATLPARGGQADRQPDGPLRDIHYRAAFDLPDSPGDNLFVLIASLERPATVALNGHQIFDSGSQALWSGPLMATPVLLQLPGPMLVRGRNELTVETEAGLIVPTRLSRIYVGRASDLAPVFKLQSFLEQQLKTMAVVAHFILGVGILFLYFARPRDVLFAWLAGLVGVSFVLSTLVYLIFHPAFSGFARYVSTLMPVLGLCALGVALAVTDIVPPRVLKVAALVLPAISVPVAFLGGERVLSLLTVLDVALLIALAVVSDHAAAVFSGGVVPDPRRWRRRRAVRRIAAGDLLFAAADPRRRDVRLDASSHDDARRARSLERPDSRRARPSLPPCTARSAARRRVWSASRSASG